MKVMHYYYYQYCKLFYCICQCCYLFLILLLDCYYIILYCNLLYYLSNYLFYYLLYGNLLYYHYMFFIIVSISINIAENKYHKGIFRVEELHNRLSDWKYSAEFARVYPHEVRVQFPTRVKICKLLTFNQKSHAGGYNE